MNSCRKAGCKKVSNIAVVVPTFGALEKMLIVSFKKNVYNTNVPWGALDLNPSTKQTHRNGAVHFVTRIPPNTSIRNSIKFTNYFTPRRQPTNNVNEPQAMSHKPPSAQATRHKDDQLSTSNFQLSTLQLSSARF